MTAPRVGSSARLVSSLIVAAGLIACGSDDGGEETEIPEVETLDLEPDGAPTQVAEGRLTCLGNPAPEAQGVGIELTGYVRLLADPEANEPPPAAKVEAFTPSGDALGEGFADPTKAGRVSVSVPITKDGFDGHTRVTHEGYLDWWQHTSNPIAGTSQSGWAWLMTADELAERADAIEIEVDADTGLLVGAVHDCDGFGVQYAVVQVDGKTDGVYYVEGFDVVADRAFTSETGRFAVPISSSGELRVKAFGRSVPEGPLELLSNATVTVETGRVASIALQPRTAAD